MDPSVVRVLATGAIVHGSLFLIGLFIAGWLTSNPIAWKCAIFGAGAAFLCFALQLSGTVNHKAAIALMAFSIAIPAIGCLSLLAR